MDETGRRTSTRYRIKVWGDYRTPNGAKRDVVILDLSEDGCRFFDKFSGLIAGQQIRLRIDRLGPYPMEVRWNDAGYVGALFERPLYEPILDHIRLQLGSRQ